MQQPTSTQATYTSRPSWPIRAGLAVCAVLCSATTIAVNLGIFEMRAQESARASSALQFSSVPVDGVPPSTRQGKS